MRKLQLLLIMICFYHIAYAFNVGAISGKLIDNSTKLPTSYASIVLTNTDTQVAGTISDEKGFFSLREIPKGDYQLKISLIGYKPKVVNISVGKLNNYNLGDISLNTNETMLNEVSVSGKTNNINPSLAKKSYSTTDIIANGGGSVLEALRNLPGITINQDGKVMLRGSDKVTILSDGRQSSLTGFGSQKTLDNIPASNIEKIEIINNPSTKLDAQGMAGIINIVYKKEIKNGLNGNVGFNFGLGELNSRKDNQPNIANKYSFTPKYNPSFSLNYRKENINIFLQSSGMFRKKVNCNEFKYTTYSYDHSKDLTSQFLENRSQQLYNIKMGIDWNISKKDVITIFGLWEDEFHIDSGDVPFDYTQSHNRKRLWSWAEDERTYNMNYQMNYRHDFREPGHKIEASIIYSHGVEDELFPFSDKVGTAIATDSTHLINKEKNIIFSIDYTIPFKSNRLEIGTKAHLRHIPISYKILNGNPSTNSLDPNLGDWSDYKNNIYSAYLNYVFESKHLEIEAGLRLEYSWVNYKIDETNQYYKSEKYHQIPLFPNIRLTYKLNANNKISAFYNRRVDRPDEFDLRPFPKYDEPEVLRTGNPYLRPQYSQILELAYKTTWNTGSFYVAGFYKQIFDTFTRVYVEDEKKINSITQNLGDSKNIGVEIVGEQTILKGWDVSANFNWYHNTIDGASGNILYPKELPYKYDKTNSNTWNLKLSTLIALPHNFSAQCSYVYYAPDIIPQGKIKSRSSFDIGIRKKIIGDKLELSLLASDLFNTSALKKEIISNDFTINSENYYETQVITLGAKYKF